MSQVERERISDRLFAAWLRLHTPTLKERTYEHQPTASPHEHQPTASPHSIPSGISPGYSTIATDTFNDREWDTPFKTQTYYVLGKPDR